MLARRTLNSWGPVCAWSAAIFVLSHQPSLPDLPNKTTDTLAKAFGHFIEFGVLSLLVYRALHRRHLDWTKAVTISIFFCLTYAISDEFHQTFVPGRHPSWSDIMIDALGVFTGLLVAVAVSVKFPMNTVGSRNPKSAYRERNR